MGSISNAPRVGETEAQQGGVGWGCGPLAPPAHGLQWGGGGCQTQPRAPWESPREERGAPERPEFKGRSLKIWLCCSQPAVPLLQQPSPHFSEGAPELRLLWGLPCAPTLGRGSASTHRDWYPPCSTTGVQWVQGTGVFPPDNIPGLALGSVWGWLDTLSARKGSGVTVLR